MKYFVTIAAVFIAIICNHSPVLAQYANLEFVENKGQWDKRVKYKGTITNGGFFLEEKGFTVVKESDEDMQRVADHFHGHTHASPAAKAKAYAPETGSLKVRGHAYRVHFVNAKTPAIVPDKPLNTYNNYFIGNDPAKWASNCGIYQAIDYKGIYPGIDARFYSSDGKLKYDFIVKPGAEVSTIALRFDGVDGLQVRNEELVIKTSVGEIRELAPYAFQIIKGEKREVNCRFSVAGKQVQFAVENYDKTQPLIIDPTLIFSTFSGSTADNWGYTATYGDDGTFYAGGIVFGTGFPVSPGAFQTNYAGGSSEGGMGGYDIGIIKFSANGTQRIYATYIGGSGNEQPNSLIEDGGGNLVIGGSTTSTNYPVTGPTIGTGGGSDIIITKLNVNGTALVGSRKIGGPGRDGVNVRPKSEPPLGVASIRRNYGDDSRSEIMVDDANNIILVSSTQSAAFPVTAGAFQTTFGGQQDGVIIKMTPDVANLTFASFLGGNGDDAAFVIAINPLNGNYYIGGNTTSTSGMPGDFTGVLHATFQGGTTDGFVAIVSPNGNTISKTTYMGTTGNDMLYGIQFDRFGFPYIMGTTSGAWPRLNAPFHQAGGKQFISKLRPDLSAFVYSTVFGTNAPSPNISPVAFLVDRCENVYVSGWGGSINEASGTYPNSGTQGMSVTPDAIQSTTDGSDFYFFVLEKNATSQLYGSFFGQSGGLGEHVDGGTSRFDSRGIIYQSLCANCGRGANFPTTPGAWAGTNGSTNCNLAAVKIAFDFDGVGGEIQSSINGVPRDSAGCVPLRVDFEDLLAEAQTYIWHFGDGSAPVTTTLPNVSHVYNAIGDYRVMLVAVDSMKCNISDTSYQTIRVREDQALLGFNYIKVGDCASNTFRFTNTTVSATGKPFTNQSFRWIFDDGSPVRTTGTAPFNHNFPGPGTYTVKLVVVDTSFCNAPDTLTQVLRISPNVQARVQNADSSACAPFTITFDNNSLGGENFIWDFGDGTTSNQASPTKTFTTPGTYHITLVANDNTSCNLTDTLRFRMIISGSPSASFVYTPRPPRENTAVEFVNTSVGAVNYKWEFGDGEIEETTSRDPVSHLFNETRTYQTCLVAINQYGCADTACAPIQARVIPLIDVPNAFTPNGDGVNDRVFVRGFGIAKMTWRIYNRWGAVVFQTNNRNEGWDGYYNGAKQPKEVYHYVLDVEFSDGKKYQKKGDITLL